MTGSAAASAMLIFQALLPFLLLAGDSGADEPILLEISGGTNVSFSLSYEYLDQVLLPSLETWFGIRVERVLVSRGWSTGGWNPGGSASRGLIRFTIHPLPTARRFRSLVGSARFGLPILRLAPLMPRFSRRPTCTSP